MQPFDDLEDFGAFDDAVSGDVRDPCTELGGESIPAGSTVMPCLGAANRDEQLPVLFGK